MTYILQDIFAMDVASLEYLYEVISHTAPSSVKYNITLYQFIKLNKLFNFIITKNKCIYIDKNRVVTLLNSQK